MKYVLALALILFLGGCEPDQEDRDFYYTGWVHPSQTGHPQAPNTKGQPFLATPDTPAPTTPPASPNPGGQPFLETPEAPPSNY